MTLYGQIHGQNILDTVCIDIMTPRHKSLNNHKELYIVP